LKLEAQEKRVAVAHYQLEGKLAVIQMDDGKANALSESMIAELEEALDRAEREAAAVVLTGRADRFCAGFDLRVMMSSPDAAVALLRRGAALLMRLYGSPLPIVAASTGHALAGGALVLLTADVRIGAAGAFRIGLNEVSIGLPIPVLAMELARDRIAVSELVAATLCGTIYSPEEAVRAGYLDHVVSANELLAQAKEKANKLGELSRMAYAGSKKRMRGKTISHILATLDDDVRSITGGS
jgi:enoyl-CoA hydratase